MDDIEFGQFRGIYAIRIFGDKNVGWMLAKSACSLPTPGERIQRISFSPTHAVV